MPGAAGRVALSMVLAAGAGVGLTACGSGSKPSVSAIAARLSTDTRFDTLDPATLTCIAGVLHRYASPGNLTSYLRTGQESGTEPSAADEAAVATALQRCVAGDGSAG